MHPDFVAKRLIALQHYINVVFMNPILASSLPSRRFVDPEVYNQSFADLAIQNASLCLRNDGQYVLGLSLGAIGWRLRKHYFRVTNKSTSSKGSDYVKTGGKHVLVKSSSQSAATAQQLAAGTATAAQVAAATTAAANELTLTWTEYGPDKYLDDKECMGVIKSLAAASHPYIQPIEYVAGNDSGVLVVRRFAARGTVKDLLCGSQPKSLFLQKYGNPNGRNALAVRDIALWSRQILEALRFLHEKGMPFGHCHAGNVIIVDGQARLLDVENFVLGVASFYRPYFMQHSKIFTAECIDVYSFGHLVYEMATGHALQESVARHPIEATGSLSMELNPTTIDVRHICIFFSFRNAARLDPIEGSLSSWSAYARPTRRPFIFRRTRSRLCRSVRCGHCRPQAQPQAERDRQGPIADCRSAHRVASAERTKVHQKPKTSSQNTGDDEQRGGEKEEQQTEGGESLDCMEYYV